MKKYRFIFILFCVSGCIYQIQRVSQNYFKYRTVTSVNVVMDEEFNDPQLSVCFNLTALLDSQFKGERFKGTSYVELNRITDKEVFENTPKLEELVTSCRIRSTGVMYQIEHLATTECIELLTSRTILHRNDLCYRIGLLDYANRGNTSIPPFSYTPQDANVIFSITLNTESNYVYGYASEEGTSGTIDSLFLTVWDIPGSESQEWENDGSDGQGFNSTQEGGEELESDASSSKLIVSYGIVEITRMEYPYQTNCRDYKHALSKDSRTFECINQGMNQTLNKSFFAYYHDFNSTTGGYLTTLSDFDDDTFRDNYNEIEASCNETFQDVCTLKFTFSESVFIPGHQKSFSGPGHELTVILTIPQSPSVKVKHEAAQDVEDFLCLVSSCFGTWLGMSALSGLDILVALIEKLIAKKKKSRVSPTSIEKKRKEQEVVDVFDEKLHPKLMRDVGFLVTALIRIERDRNMTEYRKIFVRRTRN